MTTSTEASYHRGLRDHLVHLRLTTAAEQSSAELDRALRDNLLSTHVLEHLLKLEVEKTRARRQRRRLRYARYPVHKTLADFDFQSSLDRKLVAELRTLRFVEQRRNLILLGPPGVGETTWPSRSAWLPPKRATAPTSPALPTWSRPCRAPTWKACPASGSGPTSSPPYAQPVNSDG